VIRLSAQLAPLNERIAVSSTAAPDYTREQPGQKGPRPETYVFAEGRFFPGKTKDASVDRLAFKDLVRQLAPDLAQQRFFPAKEAAAADLLIYVHWGVSEVHDDPLREASLAALGPALQAMQAQATETGLADPSAVNQVADALSWAQENQQGAMQRNAVLLGYARDLGRQDGTDGGYVDTRRQLLLTELAEERYFVVLQAFDYKSVQKGGQPKLRWVTRLSVRTYGNNFREALPVLAQAGSHVFGRQVNSLVHLKANLPRGQVSLRELQILGVVDEPPPNVVSVGK
jgi:hypothetical protein